MLNSETYTANSSIVSGIKVPPSVSIIVCTKNRADMLRKTIKSILEVDIDSLQQVELVIVDNGSTDDTVSVTSEFNGCNININYIHVSTPGKSRALNAGVYLSKHELLMFTDDDVIVPKCWISGTSKLFNDSSVHAVQGRIRLHPNWVKPWMEGLHRTFMAEFDSKQACGLVGANMAIRKQSLLECGGFEENLGPGSAQGFGEDDLIGQLLTRRFGSIKVNNGDPVIHCPRIDRLTRKSLFTRMEQQVKTEMWFREANDSPFSLEARRPIWLNMVLFYTKILRDRLLHPCSPATQDELGGYRSLLLSMHYRHHMKSGSNG